MIFEYIAESFTVNSSNLWPLIYLIMTGPACLDINPNCMLLRNAIKHAKLQRVEPAISNPEGSSGMYAL